MKIYYLKSVVNSSVVRLEAYCWHCAIRISMNIIGFIQNWSYVHNFAAILVIRLRSILFEKQSNFLLGATQWKSVKSVLSEENRLECQGAIVHWNQCLNGTERTVRETTNLGKPKWLGGHKTTAVDAGSSKTFDSYVSRKHNSKQKRKTSFGCIKKQQLLKIAIFCSL